MMKIPGPGNPLAKQCVEAYSRAFGIGIKMLLDDLKNASPYDHDHPVGKYEDKNTYFNRANIVGYPFLTGNLTGLSKDYYWRMFNRIIDSEKSTKILLNKGMICANWGVSDLAEGDIDGGIAHLLWAGYEDRGWSKTSYVHNIFQSPLYIQFAEGKRRQGKSQFGGSAPHVIFDNAISAFNKAFKTSFTKDKIFHELKDNDEHRAVLEGALWTLARNLPILEEESEKIFHNRKQNIYTKLRIFNSLVDLCRFIELRIRHREKPPKKVKMLGQLIKYVFGKETWFTSEVEPNPKGAQTPQDFDDRVRKFLQLKAPARNILLLWVTRNYSVHVSNVETPYFFDNLIEVLQSIVGVYLFYLKFRKIL